MEIKKKQYKKPKEIEENFTVPHIPESIPDYNGLVEAKFYFNGMEPIVENYLPTGITLTPEELISFKNGMRRLGTGLRSSIPVTCYGDKCPFKSQCPLHKIGKAPTGKSCPIEEILMDQYTKRYLDEFEVSADSMSEVTTMTMLAATHIMEMRGFMVLGKDDENERPDGFLMNVIGFNSDEEPIVQTQEHPAYQTIERAWRWRKNLLESLVGTRKERYKQSAAMGESATFSPSTAAADLKAKIDKMNILDISEDD